MKKPIATFRAWPVAMSWPHSSGPDAPRSGSGPRTAALRRAGPGEAGHSRASRSQPTVELTALTPRRELREFRRSLPAGEVRIGRAPCRSRARREVRGRRGDPSGLSTGSADRADECEQEDADRWAYLSGLVNWARSSADRPLCFVVPGGLPFYLLGLLFELAGVTRLQERFVQRRGLTRLDLLAAL